MPSLDAPSPGASVRGKSPADSGGGSMRRRGSTTTKVGGGTDDEEEVMGRATAQNPDSLDAASYRFIIESELKGLPLFSECATDFIRSLSRAAEVQTHPPNSAIRREGDEGSSLLLVLRGAVSQMVAGHAVGTLRAGDYFGETNLFGFEDYWAMTLHAEASSTFCEIRRQDFMNALLSHPAEQPRFQHVLDMRRARRIKEGTVVNPCMLLRGSTAEGLAIVDRHMVQRLFFKGQSIIQEGKASAGLYIMVCGRASYEIAGRTVRVEADHANAGSQRSALVDDDHRGSITEDAPPMTKNFSVWSGHTCFGESEVLGLQKSPSATVVCRHTCQVRILYKPVLTRLLSTHSRHLSTSTISQLIKLHIDVQADSDGEEGGSQDGEQVNGSSLAERLVAPFVDVGCSRPFVDFLMNHLEDRFFNADQDILSPADCREQIAAHVIRIGSVKVVIARPPNPPPAAADTRRGARPAPAAPQSNSVTLVAGQIFGGVPSIGLDWLPPGAIAVRPLGGCVCTRVLHRSVVVRGLELFPEDLPKILPGVDCSGTDVFDALQKSQLFAGMDQAPLLELSNAVVNRIFMPGDLVMEQGMVGTSMFITVAGTADILMRRQDPDDPDADLGDTGLGSVVAKLQPGSVCGELAMLGVSQVRTATIMARSVCIFAEVTRENALTILERYPVERELFGQLIAQHLEIAVTSRVCSLPLFAGFERKTRDKLTLYCERKVFFPEQYIMREGEPGDRLHIINIGQTMLKKLGFSIRLIGPGGHVGAENMLGISKTTLASLLVMTMCHCLSISKESYEMALAEISAHQAGMVLLKRQRHVYEKMSQTVQRVIARKRMWSRYQKLLVSEFLSSEDPLRHALQEWRAVTETLRRRRIRTMQEEARRQESVDHWLGKLNANRQKNKERDRIQELVRTNLGGRGPMLFYEAGRPTPQELEREQELLKRRQRARSKRRQPELKPPPTASEALASLLREWPTPKASPHYTLKVWDVLGRTLRESPAAMEPILRATSADPGPGVDEVSDCDLDPRGSLGTAPLATAAASLESAPADLLSASPVPDPEVRPATAPPDLQTTNKWYGLGASATSPLTIGGQPPPSESPTLAGSFKDSPTTLAGKEHLRALRRIVGNRVQAKMAEGRDKSERDLTLMEIATQYLPDQAVRRLKSINDMSRPESKQLRTVRLTAKGEGLGGTGVLPVPPPPSPRPRGSLGQQALQAQLPPAGPTHRGSMVARANGVPQAPVRAQQAAAPAAAAKVLPGAEVAKATKVNASLGASPEPGSPLKPPKPDAGTDAGAAGVRRGSGLRVPSLRGTSDPRAPYRAGADRLVIEEDGEEEEEAEELEAALPRTPSPAPSPRWGSAAWEAAEVLGSSFRRKKARP